MDVPAHFLVSLVLWRILPGRIITILAILCSHFWIDRTHLWDTTFKTVPIVPMEVWNSNSYLKVLGTDFNDLGLVLTNVILSLIILALFWRSLFPLILSLWPDYTSVFQWVFSLKWGEFHHSLNLFVDKWMIPFDILSLLLLLEILIISKWEDIDENINYKPYVITGIRVPDSKK